MQMSEIKKKIEDNKFFVVFCLILFSIFIVSSILVIPDIFGVELPLKNAPEQKEDVIVIDKRVIHTSSVQSWDGYHDNNKYLIKFQFPDGSIKELNVATTGSNSSDRGSTYRSINIGDEGILTYKELEDVEERYEEKNRYQGRTFISFERHVVADEE